MLNEKLKVAPDYNRVWAEPTRNYSLFIFNSSFIKIQGRHAKTTPEKT